MKTKLLTSDKNKTASPLHRHRSVIRYSKKTNVFVSSPLKLNKIWRLKEGFFVGSNVIPTVLISCTSSLILICLYLSLCCPTLCPQSESAKQSCSFASWERKLSLSNRKWFHHQGDVWRQCPIQSDPSEEAERWWGENDIQRQIWWHAGNDSARPLPVSQACSPAEPRSVNLISLIASACLWCKNIETALIK